MREFPRENVVSAMGLRPPSTSGSADPGVEEFVQGIRHRSLPDLRVPLLHWEREEILPAGKMPGLAWTPCGAEEQGWELRQQSWWAAGHCAW